MTSQESLSSLKRSRDLFGFSAVPDVGDIGYARRRRHQMGVSNSTVSTSTQPTSSTTTLTTTATTVVNPKAPPVVTTITTGKGSQTNSDTTGAGASTAASNILSTLAVPPPAVDIPTPTWHAPWKLSTVVSSHLGWVRCIAFDPANRLVATGAADRVIKIFNFPKASAGAEDALQWTLTGHISAVRGLEFSDRHPYLFSVAEDKTVKCWDLETNQVVRHYHGHLSGVYAVKLHPTLDILVTAGRDAVARVWDMRSKTQIHCLSGHEHTITSLLTASTHPQIVTASHDATIKLWDLAAGKCFTTLTHHHKSVRGLADAAGRERTFVSASADGTLRKWQGKNGKFLKTMRHDDTTSKKNSPIWNTVAVQDEGVMVTGSDSGALDFWDYDTGYCFQRSTVAVQPGSLAQSESGILCSAFDKTGTRLVTGGADKTIQIWRQQDEEATEISHPIDMEGWAKTCRARAMDRY